MLMRPFRFVHAADFHLDSPFKGLSEVATNLQPVLREATFRAVKGIVDLCIKREAHFLLIAGDVYDAADRSLRGLARLRSEFERLAEHQTQVFICHGNHDPLSGWGAKFTWPDNVHVFGAVSVEAKPVLQKGYEIARVYGISYDTEHVTKNLAQAFRKEPQAPWSIGLLHANVGNDTNHLNYAPCDLKDLIESKMDYWALGHVHTHKVLHALHPVVIYPGNPQGRHRRESGARGCYVVEVGEQGIPHYEFVAVDMVRWHEERILIEGPRDVEDLLTQFTDRVHELRRHSGGRGIIVRWRVEGRGQLHRELARPGRLEDILATLRDRWGSGSGFVWSESLVDETARDLDIETMRQEENLLGDFLRLAEEAPDSLVQELGDVISSLYDDPRIHRYLDSPHETQIRQWIQSAERLGIDRLLTTDE